MLKMPITLLDALSCSSTYELWVTSIIMFFLSSIKLRKVTFVPCGVLFLQRSSLGDVIDVMGLRVCFTV